MAYMYQHGSAGHVGFVCMSCGTVVIVAPDFYVLSMHDLTMNKNCLYCQHNMPLLPRVRACAAGVK